LAEFATIITPDTILRWHRMLIARKSDFNASGKSSGRVATDAASHLTQISTFPFAKLVGSAHHYSHLRRDRHRKNKAIKNISMNGKDRKPVSPK